MVNSMKKMICVVLATLVAMSVFAFAHAEEKSSLSDFSSRLQGKSNAQTETAEASAAEDDGMSYGPSVKIDDPFFKKVRSSAYVVEDKYSKEANVMIELKNVSGRTLYPDTASIAAYTADGKLLEEETYSSMGPEMVVDGGSLYVWDWFYNFDYATTDIGYYVVKIESETSSYTTYEQIGGEALVSDGIAYALVENKSDYDIYGVSATICIENNEGTLLDVCDVSTGNAVGIFPGSVMILRDNAKDYQNDSYLTEAKATAIVLHEID